MSLLSSIFENETVKKTAFSMVKKMMVENKAAYMIVKFDDRGELDVETCADGFAVVKKLFGNDATVIPSPQLKQIEEIMQEQARIIGEHADTIVNLTAAAFAHRPNLSIVSEQPEPGLPGWSGLCPELSPDGTINNNPNKNENGSNTEPA